MTTNDKDSSTGLRSIRLVDGRPIQETQAVEIIDQLLLPHEFKWITITNPIEAHQAIKAMNIRGAPAIGSLAALSLACGLLRLLKEKEKNHLSVVEIGEYLEINSKLLVSARPTAVNLQEAIDRIQSKFNQISQTNLIKISEQDENIQLNEKEILNQLIETCESIWKKDIEINKQIGKSGAEWIIARLKLKPGEKISVLTVCNTGSLATSGYGTALGIITSLHELGRLEHTYFMQTTPYLQGARLTSLELQALNIPASMVCDSAVGWLVQSGRIHAFIAGADRIAANGDTANKISTYQIALICKHAKRANQTSREEIPVIIAAPRSTIDLRIKTGAEIKIEERSSIEACTVRGKILQEESQEDENDLKVATVLVTPVNTHALNPAFDVTPAHLIHAIVTQFGPISLHSTPLSDPFDLASHLPSAL